MAKPQLTAGKRTANKRQLKNDGKAAIIGKAGRTRMINPDQQGDRANIRQNTRNIDRRTMR